MSDQQLLIIGANGQLGRALKSRYPGAQVVDSDKLNIANRNSVMDFDYSGIQIILNAAAYTNVDGAETTEGRLAAWQVNAVGASNLTQVAIARDLTLVHISTDYVFDGHKSEHSEDETFGPLNVYGQSKAAGDIVVSTTPRHYLLRTSWVIGDGNNFVTTMLNLGSRGISPTVVADQIGRLTFTSELVRAIDFLLVSNAAWGTYNVSNGGQPVSWADITRQIFEDAAHDIKVTDTTTDEYYAKKPASALRPLNSTLSLNKLKACGFQFIDWQEDLKRYVNQYKENNS